MWLSCVKQSAKKDSGESASAIEQKYPAKVENEGTAVEGTTLKVAYVHDSGFKGILSPILYSDGIDGEFTKHTMAGAFPIDGDFKLVLNSDTTPIKVTIDEKNKTVAYKINPKFKWSNGDTVTTKDIVKTYEIIANQKYIDSAQSVRYDGDMKNIVGIEDYNTQKAKTISGLEVIDDANMKIHLKELTPNMLWGAGFAGEFVNAKQYEGIAMDKIITSDALRKNPLSYGPYVIKSIVPGEKIVYEANKYYYKGEAKVKNVEMEILPPSQQVAAIKAGKYDLVYDVKADVFPQLTELDNIKLATRMDLYMAYMGFKLGKWDSKRNMVITNPEAKMGDAKLRKAMAMAIDNDTLGKKFYNGLRFAAPSPIAPIFKSLHDDKVTGNGYSEEKAKQLLDEAGYKDTNNDGIREDKAGKPFKINFAMMSGGEIQEPLSQYYLQQWKKIGLDVSLIDGRLLELQNFYQRVQADDPKIDMYMAAFNLGSDPNPSGLYGKDAPFNFSRYTSQTLQKSLDNISSKESLDPAKMQAYYHEFEKVFMEEAPSIPMMNRVEVLPINNRVKMYNYSWNDEDTDFGWDKIELTQKAPVAAKK